MVLTILYSFFSGGTRNISVVVTTLHAQINLNKLKEINHGTIDYVCLCVCVFLTSNAFCHDLCV